MPIEGLLTSVIQYPSQGFIIAVAIWTFIIGASLALGFCTVAGIISRIFPVYSEHKTIYDNIDKPNSKK